ncbi:MAG: tRNA-dihydrouridine synthase [Paludibaculum sp.]
MDINFGCPVKKVVTCNGGSGLLRDLAAGEKDSECGARVDQDSVDV